MRLEAAPGSLQLGSPPDTRLVPGLSSDLGPPEPIHGPQRALWPHVCGSKAKVARATRGAVARGVLRAKPGPRERFFSAPAGSPGEKFPLPPPPHHAHTERQRQGYWGWVSSWGARRAGVLVPNCQPQPRGQAGCASAWDSRGARRAWPSRQRGGGHAAEGGRAGGQGLSL